MFFWKFSLKIAERIGSLVIFWISHCYYECRTLKLRWSSIPDNLFNICFFHSLVINSPDPTRKKKTFLRGNASLFFLSFSVCFWKTSSFDVLCPKTAIKGLSKRVMGDHCELCADSPLSIISHCSLTPRTHQSRQICRGLISPCKKPTKGKYLAVHSFVSGVSEGVGQLSLGENKIKKLNY